MSKFLPTKRNNPCPICSDISGDCRTTETDLILCHSFPDGDVPGWDYKGRDRGQGIWGMYAPSLDHLTPEQKDHWQAEQDRKRRERLDKESAQYRNGLTRTERDRNIRAIAAYVGLTSRHHQQLLERGLTPEAIKAGLYFSVTPDLSLPPSVSDKLPGVSYRNGKKVLISAVTGFACVAFDDEGQAVGWQIRDENPDAENKYRWAKSAFSSHLQNAELPLTVRGDGSTVWLTEAILKPDVASCKFGIKCIGSSGGNFLGSKQQLKKYLGDSQRVIIAPDAGDAVNKQVYQRWCKVIKYLTKSGYDVAIAWWGQITKDSPDIDELENLNDVQCLTPKEWHREVAKVRKYEAWRQFTPDITLNRQFLSGKAVLEAIKPYLCKVPTTGLIVGINAPLGGNKTGSTGELLNMLPPIFKGMGVIQLSDLNSLLHQTVERYNEIAEKLRESGEDGRTFYHLHEDEAYELVAGDENLAACFQSLERWLDEHFDYKIISLDESLSAIKSFLDGDTLEGTGRQTAIAKKLRELFKRSALILLLDGNLTDKNCALVQEISGKELVKIKNIQPTPRLFTFREWTEKELLIASAIEDIKLLHQAVTGVDNPSEITKGNVITITADNASELRSIYEQLLKLGITPEQLIIADKKSTDDEFPPEFKRNSSKYIKENPQILAVLYSPSMNRGFDLDGSVQKIRENIYGKQYAFFEGIIGLDQIDQQIFRSRSEFTERHLWITEKAKPNPRFNGYTKQTIENFEQSAKLLDNFGSDALKAEFNRVTDLMVKEFHADPFFKYEQDMREAERYESESLRERFKEFMTRKNCTFTPAIAINEDLVNLSADGVEMRKAIKKEWKAEQETKARERSARMAIAPLTLDALEDLKQRNPEQYEGITAADVARKIRLEKVLPTFTSSSVCTPENVFLIEENPDIIEKLKRYSLLNEHGEKLAIAKLEKDVFKAIADFKATGYTYLSEFRTELGRIKAALKIGLPEFIQRFQNEPFNKDTPELIEIMDKASSKGNAKQLGWNPSKDIIKNARKLSSGYGVKVILHKTVNGERWYRFSPVLPCELHEQILASLRVKNLDFYPETHDWESLLLGEEKSGCRSTLDLYRKKEGSAPTQSNAQQALQPISTLEKNEPQKPPILAVENPVSAPQKIPPAEQMAEPAPVATAIAPETPPDILDAVQDAIIALTQGNRTMMQDLCDRLQNFGMIRKAASELEAIFGVRGMVDALIRLWIRPGIAIA